MPPRQRPPGTAAFLALLLLVPFLTAAAQQQQPQGNGVRTGLRSPPEGSMVDTVVPERRKRTDTNTKKKDYTPLISKNERAIATLANAPAVSNPAVRAPPALTAAKSGGLSSRPSARSLQDWEVEDFVLLATVDGKLHARDRNTGESRWSLETDRPMVETIYHPRNKSETEEGQPDDEVLWIVEPSQDGNLYVYTPGPKAGLQKLGITVKQLAEELSPFASDEPPVVYTAEKMNKLYTVDAGTGRIQKLFSSQGSTVVDSGGSCKAAPGLQGLEDEECEPAGTLILGQTEYTIGIQKLSGEAIATIKYFEWSPNNRDKDLQSQYMTTMDNKYIYSRHDGSIIALDHKHQKTVYPQRPVYQRKFDSPVVRVYDVARPYNPEVRDDTLVILPQPLRPAETEVADIWINCTESGSFYAMSEFSYPTVTDGASKAKCYNNDLRNTVLWEGMQTPKKTELVGVHSLAELGEQSTSYPAIGGIDTPLIEEPPIEEVGMLPPAPGAEAKGSVWSPLQLICALLLLMVCGIPIAKPSTIDLMRDAFPKLQAILPKKSKAVSAPELEIPQQIETTVGDKKSVGWVDLQQEPPQNETGIPEISVTDHAPTLQTEESKESVDEIKEYHAENGEQEENEATGADGAPVKKKKAHRGQRGGRKRKKSQSRQPGTEEGDEEAAVEEIVQQAKQLGESPAIQSNEVTVIDGGNIQDVMSGKIQIHNLQIDTGHELGRGSGGTIVFEGMFEGRHVAVKRMLAQYYDLASHEVSLLQKSDDHPNVIRYFCQQKDQYFLYIAIELCQASLWDLFRDGRHEEPLSEGQLALITEINKDVPKALYQLAAGLAYLHSLRIIHRDIKPQNILIAYPKKGIQNTGPRFVISDFGLCKALPDNMSTLIGTTGNAGTVGWKAPELILQPKEATTGQSSTGKSQPDSSTSNDPVSQGVKRAVDIFSLGCVFFYVLSNGCHPFDDEEGWMQIRELNIKKNKYSLDRLAHLGDDCEEPYHLIGWMLSPRPEHRPTAAQVMTHPFFWSAEKRLAFLCDVSDHWEREERDPPSEHLIQLEEWSYHCIDLIHGKPDFLAKLDRKFIDTLGKQRKYTGDRMLDLLRALRNKKNHYEDMPADVKARVGALPDGYLRYWTTKFPKLLMSCYECVQQCGLQDVPRFRPYFENKAIM